MLVNVQQKEQCDLKQVVFSISSIIQKPFGEIYLLHTSDFYW
jgi:hypothetical protein